MRFAAQSPTSSRAASMDIIMGGSSGRFAGKYQMGADEIKETAARLGVQAPTREQFLKDPSMQEKFFENYTLDHHNWLMAHNAKYAAMSPEDKAAALAYAHNQGAGGASKWIDTGARMAGRDAGMGLGCLQHGGAYRFRGGAGSSAWSDTTSAGIGTSARGAARPGTAGRAASRCTAGQWLGQCRYHAPQPAARCVGDGAGQWCGERGTAAHRAPATRLHHGMT